MHDGFQPHFHGGTATDQIIFLDSEVTYPMGEDNSRRMMELALVDGYGQCIYRNYFNPGVELNNRFANKGLHDRLLRHGAKLENEYPKIQQLLVGKHVVAWWADNERTFFPDHLNCVGKLHCAQARFTPLCGKYSLKHGGFTSIGMWDAFDHLRLVMPAGGIKHRALTDALAMRQIWNWLDNHNFEAMLAGVAA